MVRLFTHKKRTYLGCDRHRMDFKITVDHINFTSNQYFLANSHYVIFRKQNKNKQFVSKNRVLNANELRMVHIDEKIKFRTCMFQDLTNRYLEKYLPKNKRFVVRQVTAVTDEELYVNCGYFELPLDIYAMQPSGQHIEVAFVDPNGKAAGTVYLIIEHEGRTRMANYLPNLSLTFQRYFFPKTHTKTPLPLSRLELNREKLDFVKQQQIEHHWSFKYDGLSSDGEGDDTHSESEVGSDAGQDQAPFNASFIMNRTGMPQVSSKGLSSKNNYLSVHLDSAMFHFEESGSEVPTLTNNRENAVYREQDSVGGSVTRVVSFDPQTIDTHAPSFDTMSTLSQSERGHLSPREAEPVSEPLPTPKPASPRQTAHAHHVTAKPGNTHVPFTGQSYKVRAGAALQDDTEDEVSTQHSEATSEPHSRSEQHSQQHIEPVRQPEGELWEDPADFDKLEDNNVHTEAEGSYKPRKSLRTVPPPIISDSSQFIAARSVQRSVSMTDSTMRENLPRYDPPAAVPQPPRKSLRGAPPPVAPQGAYIPAKVVHRAGSESSMAQIMLNMDSVDEREHASRNGGNAYIPPYVENRVERSDRSERNTKGERSEKVEKKGVRSPSPVTRHLVPVRLTAEQSATAEKMGQTTTLHSHSLSPVASQSHAHRQMPHRAQSTGDMYAGIGHRHADHDSSAISPMSVKELRRKYEPTRPPMVKEYSGNTYNTNNTGGSGNSGDYAPLSPKNLPKSDGNINVRRTTSERSYSTLSTHTDLPKRHASTAKMLVPVRMQPEEPAYPYAREQEISPLSTSTYGTSHTQRSAYEPSGQREHHLHRGVSQYSGERQYAAAHSAHNPHGSHSQSNVLDYDMRQEQHERYDRYNDAHHQGRSHREQAREHVPAHPQHHLSQHHSQYQSHQAHAQSHHQPVSQGHRRSHSAELPPTHAAQHVAHTTHHLAPPIRLTSSDYIPPQYERFVVEKHHTHVHGSDKHSAPVSGSAREGYYGSTQSRPAPPTAYRGVYA